MGRYRILSTQNEGWAASMLDQALPRAYDGGLTDGCFGNSLILGGHP